MSAKALAKAARIQDPRLDVTDHVLMMLMADRADDDGRFFAHDDKLNAELANELSALKARLRGDHTYVFGVDNDRINRVLQVMNEVREERGEAPVRPKPS
jgi:hypothetical protein